MWITIKLAGYLAHSSQGKALRAGRVELPETATLEDALVHTGLPADTPLTVAVNGVLAKPGQALKPGDTVSLIPPISGG